MFYARLNGKCGFVWEGRVLVNRNAFVSTVVVSVLIFAMFCPAVSAGTAEDILDAAGVRGDYCL